MRRRSFNNINSNERGSTMAELAMVAGVFFMILIGVIEFSRLLYTHNALTDAARRGARYAAIHKEAAEDCVKNVMIYGESHIDKANACAPTGPPLVNHLEDATINITYLGADTDNDPNDATPIDTAYGTNLGTVSVSIENYDFTLMIPFVNLTLTMPHYTTTLTAESAGEEPDPIVAP
jgi:Flp pilus assembly protein TadG